MRGNLIWGSSKISFGSFSITHFSGWLISFTLVKRIGFHFGFFRGVTDRVTFQETITFFVLFFQKQDVGATWKANTYLSVLSLNAGKYGPEKLRIRTLFTLWNALYYQVLSASGTRNLNSKWFIADKDFSKDQFVNFSSLFY